MRTGLLVLSGFNIRAVIALCRRAADASVPVHLIARNGHDPIYLTSYASQVFEERIHPQLYLATITGWIRRLRTKYLYARVVLAPSTEFFNRVLLKNRAAIEEAGGIVPLVNEDRYAQLSDKHAF